MGLKGLAEGIILQSMEDLWVKQHREDSIAFFKGKDFRDCAEMAEMTTSDQIKLLSIVKNIIGTSKENMRLKPLERPTAKERSKKVHLASIARTSLAISS